MNISQAHAGHQRVGILVSTLASDYCICPYILHTLNSGSQCMVPIPAASASRNCLEAPILGPKPDVFNKKHWEWSPAIYGVTSPPGDSCVSWSWRNTTLHLGERVGEDSEANHYSGLLHTVTSDAAWQIRKTAQRIPLSWIPNNHRNDLVNHKNWLVNKLVS